MAKKSSIEREKSRERMAKLYMDKRRKLKLLANDRSISLEKRIDASMKLAKIPRNSSVTRQRIRCKISGRSRGVYRKFGLSRIVFRELASHGQIPGVIKSSW